MLRGRSLRTKLFGAILLAALLPLFVSGWVTAWAMEDHLRSEALMDASATGELARALGQERVKRLLVVAEVIARSQAVRQATLAGERATLLALAQTSQQDLGDASVAIVDETGTVLVRAEAPDRYGDNLAISLQGLQRALRGQSTTSTEAAGEQELSYWASAPIREEGRTLGAVLVSQRFEQQLLGALSQAVGHDTFALLADGSTLGAAVDPSAAATIRQSGETFTGFIRVDGRDQAAYAWRLADPEGQTEGYLGIVDRVEELDTAVSHFRRTILAAGLLAAIGAAYLARLLSRLLIAPLERLARAARSIARGEEQPIPRVGSGDELEDLSRSLGAMVGVLSERNRGLSDLNERLAEERERTDRILDTVAAGIVTVSLKGRITFANPAAQQLLGLDPAAIAEGRDDPAWEFATPDGKPFPREELPLPRVLRTGEPVYGVELAIELPGARPVILSTNAALLRGPTGDPVALVVSLTDITERKRAEEERAQLIREQAARAQAEAMAGELQARARQQAAVAEFGRAALAGTSSPGLLQAATELVARTLEVEYSEVLELLPDGKGLLLRAGVGWSPDYVGRTIIGTEAGSWADYALRSRESVLVGDLGTETRFGELSFLKKRGLSSGLSVLIEGAEQPFGVLGAHATSSRSFSEDDANFLQSVANVITAAVNRERAEEALAHGSLYDALTELPNRTLLRDRLDQAILSSRQQGKPIAVLVIDPDRFKEINETFGHHRGDLLLRQVGERLRGALRTSDTVARLGGDEFAAVLPQTDDREASRVAGDLLHALEAPFLVDQQRLEIRASIGLSIYPDHGDDAETLLRRAYIATQAAKRAGSGHALYASEYDDYTPGRLALPGELRKAIEQDELLLHYQPKVAFQNGHLVGVEALVRWQHPQHGMLPPDQFISMAEQHGLIAPLSAWVLEAALRQCRAWHETGLKLSVAANLSARNLHDPSLPETIAELLERLELPSWSLQLEVTESAVMADPARAMEVLSGLRAMGVHIAVDDFGTGYSSLAYLKRLPVSQLKIDRSFVRDMATDNNDLAIVRATIELSHTLGLTVVAEGVEDEATWDLLVELGCDEAQGYYLSRPLPAEALTRWVSQSSRPLSTAKLVTSSTVPYVHGFTTPSLPAVTS